MSWKWLLREPRRASCGQKEAFCSTTTSVASRKFEQTMLQTWDQNPKYAKPGESERGF